MYGRQVEGRYGQRLIPMTSPAYNSTDPMIKEEGTSNGDLLHVAEEYLDGHQLQGQGGIGATINGVKSATVHAKSRN